MDVAWRICTQVGNGLQQAVPHFWTADPTTLPRIPSQHREKALIGAWFREVTQLTSNACRRSLPELLECMQRYMMRMRATIQNDLKITFASDKSKVGRAQALLVYVYSLDHNIGAMLPLQLKQALAWTKAMAQHQSSTLQAVLVEADTEVGKKRCKALTRMIGNVGRATKSELKVLDKSCQTAFGQGLHRFLPAYVAQGLFKLQPGCTSLAKLLKVLPSWSKRAFMGW